MVFAFIVFKHFRSNILVSQTRPVQEPDAAFPITPDWISGDGPLYIVLSTGKIPHEIPPIHVIHLVIKEKEQIIPERRHVFSVRVELPFSRVV